jgi:recombination protein RecT
MSKADCEAHRKKYSKAGNSPWDTNFDEMAKKTVLKKALKYAPISAELMRQLANDESVKTTFNMDDIKEGTISILDVQNDYVEADGSVVDSETGEIVKEEESK